MSATITTTTTGTITFARMIGPRPAPFLETYEEITRPNIDGCAYLCVGKRAQTSFMRTVQATSDGSYSPSSIDTIAATYASLVNAMRTEYATIVDEFGRTFNNVHVLRHTPLEVKQIVGGQGLGVTDPRILISCNWEIQLTSV